MLCSRQLVDRLLCLLPAGGLWRCFRSGERRPLLRVLQWLPLLRLTCRLHCLLPFLYCASVLPLCSSGIVAIARLHSLRQLLQLRRWRLHLLLLLHLLLRLPACISVVRCCETSDRLLPAWYCSPASIHQLQLCLWLQGDNPQPWLLGIFGR